MAAYNDDPGLRDVPIHLSELEEYVADPRPVARDPRKISHLLGRAAATVVAQKTQIRQLQHDINSIRFSADRMGTATTLAPRDAVRYLSPTELAQVVKGTHQHVLDQANKAKAQAEAHQRNMVAQQARLRLAVLDITEDETLPAEVRQRVAAAFAGVEASDDGAVSASSAPAPVTGGVTDNYPDPSGIPVEVASGK